MSKRTIGISLKRWPATLSACMVACLVTLACGGTSTATPAVSQPTLEPAAASTPTTEPTPTPLPTATPPPTPTVPPTPTPVPLTELFNIPEHRIHRIDGRMPTGSSLTYMLIGCHAKLRTPSRFFTRLGTLAGIERPPRLALGRASVALGVALVVGPLPGLEQGKCYGMAVRSLGASRAEYSFLDRKPAFRVAQYELPEPKADAMREIAISSRWRARRGGPQLERHVATFCYIIPLQG